MVDLPFNDKIFLLNQIVLCDVFYRGLNRNAIRRPKYFPLRSVIFTLRRKWNEGRKEGLWFIDFVNGLFDDAATNADHIASDGSMFDE
jgi:hypothetical protein